MSAPSLPNEAIPNAQTRELHNLERKWFNKMREDQQHGYLEYTQWKIENSRLMRDKDGNETRFFLMGIRPGKLPKMWKNRPDEEKRHFENLGAMAQNMDLPHNAVGRRQLEYHQRREQATAGAATSGPATSEGEGDGDDEEEVPDGEMLDKEAPEEESSVVETPAVESIGLDSGGHGGVDESPPPLASPETRHIITNLRRIWQYADMIYTPQKDNKVKNERDRSPTVALWVRGDTDGNICDRMVVKRVDLNRHEPDTIKLERNRLDDEIRIHLGILSPIGCSNILRCRGSSERQDEDSDFPMVYIYTDYAPFGTLDGLMSAHLKKRPIPEPFLWVVFRGMSEAIETLASGQCYNKNDEKVRKSKLGIVHFDIKPANFVLGEPPKQELGQPYSCYPTIQLADFGEAVIFGNNAGQDDFDKSRGRGTAYWKAPEALLNGELMEPPQKTDQSDRKARDSSSEIAESDSVTTNLDQETTEPVRQEHANWPMNAKTDIFCVGAIMWNLIHSHDFPNQMLNPLRAAHFDHAETYTSPLKPLPAWTGLYSQHLVTLVERCLLWNQEQRPSAEQLRQETLQGLDQMLDYYGSTFRDEVEPGRGFLPIFSDTAEERNEKYQIGERMPEPKRRKLSSPEEESSSGEKHVPTAIDNDEDDLGEEQILLSNKESDNHVIKEQMAAKEGTRKRGKRPVIEDEDDSE